MKGAQLAGVLRLRGTQAARMATTTMLKLQESLVDTERLGERFLDLRSQASRIIACCISSRGGAADTYCRLRRLWTSTGSVKKQEKP